MKQNNRTTPEVKIGWVLLGFGILLLVAGVVFRQTLPDAGQLGRFVMTFGIFFTGWGLISLTRRLAALKDPQAIRRLEIEEQDERNLAIRNQAGYGAYVFSTIASAIGLLVYSLLTQEQKGFDPIWWYLAFVVVGPGLYYVIVLIRLQTRD